MSQLRNRDHLHKSNSITEGANRCKTSVRDAAASHSAWSISFVILMVLYIVVYNELQWHLPSITGLAATTKPYRDIDSFYPYYLSEHHDPWNQRLHVIGSTIIVFLVAMKPEIAISTIIGLLSGMIVFPLFRGISHGVFEAVIMVLSASLMAHIHGVKRYLVMMALIGYGFAWIGHFHFEQNKPATFIYPSYSLVCDWKMFGAFYNQLIVIGNWDILWNQGIDFKIALKHSVH